MAKRFAQAYMTHPPGEYPHRVVVLVNGTKYDGIEKVFAPLPVEFMEHDNSGKDLGAYQKAALNIPCDLMIFLGAPVRPRKSGWLDWIVKCYLRNGPGVYGAFAFHHPSTHIRTTCWWCPPDLLNAYPVNIGNNDRYAFEHGPNSIALWAKKMGFPILQVTWRGVFDEPQWHYVTNENCLFLDQHSDSLNYT